MSSLKQRLLNAVGSFHDRSDGAIAVLTMAAVLICFMLGLALYDANTAAMDKIDVQTGADAAAWSQSAVEARTLNTISFANVAKRVVFGMTTMYRAVWGAWIMLAAAVGVIVALCWGVCVACWTCISAICTELTKWLINIGKTMAQEASDLSAFEGNLMSTGGYFHRDMKALDAYQQYIYQVTPWWSWAEGVYRGTRNGAMITASWPVPAKLGTGQLAKIGGSKLQSKLSLGSAAGYSDKIPVTKRIKNNSGLKEMCNFIRNAPLEVEAHTGDYALKSYEILTNSSSWYGAANYVITIALSYALMKSPFSLAGKTINACNLTLGMMGNKYKRDATPYALERLGGAKWQLWSSNLHLSYKPDADRLKKGETGKFDFMSTEYSQTPFGPYKIPEVAGIGLYNAGGYWGISRSEVSFRFKGGDSKINYPDLWHASWTARMRPVALPNEWSGYGSRLTFGDAVMDMLPYIAVGNVIMQIVNRIGGSGGGPGVGQQIKGFLSDGLRIYLAGDAMGDKSIEGVPK